MNMEGIDKKKRVEKEGDNDVEWTPPAHTRRPLRRATVSKPKPAVVKAGKCSLQGCPLCELGPPPKLWAESPAWPSIMETVLYCLHSIYPESESFNLKKDVYEFCQVHWHQLRLDRKPKDIPWRKQLQDCLSHGRHSYFTSLKDKLHQNGNWALIDPTKNPWKEPTKRMKRRSPPPSLSKSSEDLEVLVKRQRIRPISAASSSSESESESDLEEDEDYDSKDLHLDDAERMTVEDKVEEESEASEELSSGDSDEPLMRRRSISSERELDSADSEFSVISEGSISPSSSREQSPALLSPMPMPLDPMALLHAKRLELQQLESEYQNISVHFLQQKDLLMKELASMENSLSQKQTEKLAQITQYEAHVNELDDFLERELEVLEGQFAMREAADQHELKSLMVKYKDLLAKL